MGIDAPQKAWLGVAAAVSSRGRVAPAVWGVLPARESVAPKSLWGVGGQGARRGGWRGPLFFSNSPERSKVPRDFRIFRAATRTAARARSGRTNDTDGCGEWCSFSKT
eukprot:gene13325-biopygen20021